MPEQLPWNQPGKASGKVPGVAVRDCWQQEQGWGKAWPGLWELWVLFLSSCPVQGGGAASELGLKGILGSFLLGWELMPKPEPTLQPLVSWCSLFTSGS